MIYTSRKCNAAGQIACNCLDYCNSTDINETCMYYYTAENDDLRPCKVRFGEICEIFSGKLVERK